MGKLFVLIGKSASGKDTIYKELCKDPALGLRPVVLYTTRPIRQSEEQGREYYFITREQLEQMDREGKIIERRTYDTIHGEWVYSTAADENLRPDLHDYLMIGTIEAYLKLRDYFGKELVCPIYVEVEDGLRLERALKRERKPQNRKFEEMCRRFLSDSKDYSEENIRGAGIERRFLNEGEREDCIREIRSYILQCKA